MTNTRLLEPQNKFLPVYIQYSTPDTSMRALCRNKRFDSRQKVASEIEDHMGHEHVYCAKYSPHMSDFTPILDIRDLAIDFCSDGCSVRAVRVVSLTVAAGETLALVGESGSGKSVTCLSIMNLLPETGSVVQGDILFNGKSLTTMDADERRSLRGSSIGMIFQEPMTSLNPLFRIGAQVAEAVQCSSGGTKESATRKAEELLERVRIPEAKKRLRNYPHELSGGMRQRVMIAMALAGNPSLLIADEPTTALDVTVQAQILDLLGTLQQELKMAMLFVTHDLGVVAGLADRVCVMYSGQVVEEGPVNQLFASPLMPYTKGLLRSVPALQGEGASSRLQTIPGQGPQPGEILPGCHFAPRCEAANSDCIKNPVAITSVNDRRVRCLRHNEWGQS